MGKGLIEDRINCLFYLVKESNNLEQRKESVLRKKFGDKHFENILSLLFYNFRFIECELVSKSIERYFRITPTGLNFLEEYKKGKRQESNAKTTLFLTSIIVLTTIANFFNELGLTNKVFLMIIYLIFAVLLLLYFKKAKVITI